MTHYLIYKITNKVNGKIYIGKHQTEDLDDGYMGSGIEINRAIKKYGKENFTKEILFDVYGPDLMNFLEEAIVDEAFVARKDTYNIAPGGQGGAVCGKHLSEEHRRKISESCKGKNTGKHRSEETRQKISEAQRGKSRHPLTEETKRKIGDANRGRRLSEESRQHISEAHKGKPSPRKGKKFCPLSMEHKKKLSEVMKGRHHSTESRKKMSEAQKGHPGYMKGKHHSEETRKKISEARKAYQSS